jgi:hypothetical protein
MSKTASAQALRDAAELGAAWLDEHDPGWAARVDPGALRMRSACNCVLGQLARDRDPYEAGFGFWAYLARTGRAYDLPWAVEHGFAVAGRGSGLQWEPLGDIWRELIADRSAGPR